MPGDPRFPTYWAWLKRLKDDPTSQGPMGCAVVAVALCVALAGTIGLVLLLPRGRYPRILLMAPGIGLGLATFCVLSILLYRVRKRRFRHGPSKPGN